MKFQLFIISLLFPSILIASDNYVDRNKAKIELGRHLFHDSRLSLNGNRSCGICHNPNTHWTNSFQRVPDIYGRVTNLNTPSLLNVASRGCSTTGLTIEKSIINPIINTDPLEMGMSTKSVINRLKNAHDLYAPLFIQAYGDSDITFPKVITALLAFIETIYSRNTAYHRFISGDENALSSSARNGFELFNSKRLGCSSCHSGGLLNERNETEKVEGDNVDSRGLFNVNNRNHEYLEGEINVHNISRCAPSLINVVNTGPWGYDGRYNSLHSILDAYVNKVIYLPANEYTKKGAKKHDIHRNIKGSTITDKEKKDLISFFYSLSIDDFETIKNNTESPFCQLVKLKNKSDKEDCLKPFRVKG